MRVVLAAGRASAGALVCRRLCRLGAAAARGYQARAGVFGHLPERDGAARPEADDVSAVLPVDAASAFVSAYRRCGYRVADLDPLRLRDGVMIDTVQPIELERQQYNLSDVSQVHRHLPGCVDPPVADAAQLESYLQSLYCGRLAAQFEHLENAAERAWWAENFERAVTMDFSDAEMVDFARLMVLCQEFDHYLQLKFSSVKRYGCEGAESMLPLLHAAFQHAAADNSDCILCMAHRGRLNVLQLLLQLDPVTMFRKMAGKSEFVDALPASGDVLSHLTAARTFDFDQGHLRVEMLANPSHLEAVNPVAMGMCRAKMLALKVADYDARRRDDGQSARPGDGVLCVQIHGDAAFTGQGVVWESLAMSQVPHFRVGGSLHVITNNQIGYTAEATIGRSTRHVTDMAKGIDCPALHVNALCPADDPTFTQPLMYERVHDTTSMADAYCAQLQADGVLSEGTVQDWKDDYRTELQQHFAAVQKSKPVAAHAQGAAWSKIVPAPDALQVWDTGVDEQTLRFVAEKSVTLPDGFRLHTHLSKHHCDARLSTVAGDGSAPTIDWATAEAMAFGTLLLQGTHVRLSGQDVGRGTFSQRHCSFVDQSTDAVHVPLNHMQSDQAHLEVANSLLSEQAVVAFEYGFSLEHPDVLCVWEAQFGDFFNGAQITLDTFVSSGEEKWLYYSGLVLVLPHGLDGMGPEHSSARMERFLQLSDSRQDRLDADTANWAVVNPTTPAQYFHALRRQQVRNYRKPLVVVGPKVLLRDKLCLSRVENMAPGTYFHTVLPDTLGVEAADVQTVVLCSGKHYYTLLRHVVASAAYKESRCAVALVRLEQLCPFPAQRLHKVLAKYPNATNFIYSQEEQRNQGAWEFVRTRVSNLLNVKLEYAGRAESAIPAVAIGEQHRRQADQVLQRTFQLHGENILQ